MFGLEFWHIWLGLGILLFIGEVLHMGFIMAFFGAGAIVSAIAAAMGVSFEYQLLIFAISSLIFTLIGRPFFKKLTAQKTATNVDALIGRRGNVVEEINNAELQGRVLLGGDDWRALSLDDSIIEKGARVEVVEVESVKIIVKRAG
jgi:membrane protein implicated in regulation of membrane protease activity